MDVIYLNNIVVDNCKYAKPAEAERLANIKNCVRIYLHTGEMLDSEPHGIKPPFNYEGEELNYDILLFKPFSYAHPIDIKNGDIIKAELI